MIPTEFTGRKIRRKLVSDGAVETVRAAGDLLTRKRLGRPIFDPLVERDIVRTLPREKLDRTAKPVHVLDSATSTPFVSLAKDGIVLTETGLALTNTFDIIEESAAGPDQAQQAMMAMLSRELFYGELPLRGLLFGHSYTGTGHFTLRSEPVAPLIPRYPENYYHWMVETVPKIRYLRAFETEREPVTLLVPSDAPPFVDETLDLLGWPNSRVVRATEPMYEIENLVLPSFPERRPADFNWLRTEMLETLSSTEHIGAKADKKNIYVSRKNTIERRVTNEKRVMAVLEDYGFRRYYPEDHSIIENVQSFSRADVIVGPHGAGLTDIIFATEDSTLLELFGEKVKEPYKHLAETIGMDYEPVYCQSDASDIIVDTAKLKQMLSNIS